jgi:transcriptional regulator with XRE-family HTH domain
MPEAEKARLWRIAMGFSRRELAQLTGFSESLIADIEVGHYRENEHPISDRAMRRYRLACAAITADVHFDWYRVNGRPVGE